VCDGFQQSFYFARKLYQFAFFNVHFYILFPVIMSCKKAKNSDLKIERLIQNGQINIWLHLRETKMLCLICREVLFVPKECNIRGHCEVKQSDLTKLDVSEKQLKRRAH
jgi:hypothetical protein